MAARKSDFDGDGSDELLVTSPWGLGALKLSGNTMRAPMMEPNGARFQALAESDREHFVGDVARSVARLGSAPR